MSFGKAPQAPNPTTTADTQQGYNIAAAEKQQGLNSYNQSTPFGTLSYIPDASSPSGYRLNTELSPAQQKLLEQYQGNQGSFGALAGNLGGTASNLATNSAGLYSQPADISGKGTADLLNKWQQDYLAPIFKQQQTNTDAQLRNQGLTPGSEAYNNAENLLARNQGDVTTNYLTKNQGQAFAQALQNYQLPLETLGKLVGTAGGAFSAGAPIAPTFQSTPTAQVQPPNYAGQVQQNYQNQLAQYQAKQAGLWGIPTALAGGWAKGGFPGMSSLGGMFGGGAAAGGSAAAGAGMGTAAESAALLAELGPLAAI